MKLETRGALRQLCVIVGHRPNVLTGLRLARLVREQRWADLPEPERRACLRHYLDVLALLELMDWPSGRARRALSHWQSGCRAA